MSYNQHHREVYAPNDRWQRTTRHIRILYVSFKFSSMWRTKLNEGRWDVICGDVHATSLPLVVSGQSAVWSGAMASRVATWPRWRLVVPGHGYNEVDELCEIVHVVGSAPRSKHVVGKIIKVVALAVVGIEECLYMPPRVLGRYLNA